MRLIAPNPLAWALPILFLAAPAAAQTADVAPVVAAERAFAADFPAMGLFGSFSKWSTPDAVIISGGQARTSAELFTNAPAVRQPDEPLIEWWPVFAGVAMSGDLGFTTGPASQNGNRYGHYFTVWKRQPDGQWRWVYDGGVGADPASQPGPDSEPRILPVVTVGSASPEAAMAEVEEAEAGLAAQAASGQKAAYLQYLAADGRLYVAPLAPAEGPEAFAAALDGWPQAMAIGSMEGGGSSDAGDMVWTYGPASWTRDGQPRHGHYVRIWQKRPEGWRIVLAQLIPAPPPAPPPA